MKPLQDGACLLLVDIQTGILESLSYYGGSLSKWEPENIEKLLSAFRSTRNVHVIHVKHNSTNEGSPLRPSEAGNAIMECAEPLPGEMIFSKTTNGAFASTELEDHLRSLRVKSLIVCGLVTNHCVSTTVRTAADLGIVSRDELFVVSDATAATAKGEFDAETIHKVNLASLQDEFAQVVTTADVLHSLSS